MKKEVAKQRNYMVDLCRFIAAFMIMFCHLDLVGYKTYPTYMFVDFFFILSGYFTVQHFAKIKHDESPDKRGRLSLLYTAKKFMPFIPHLLIALPIAYAAKNINLLQASDWGGFFLGFKDMIAEFLLLPISFFEGTSRQLGPLWYLSALLIAMPLFSYICQSKYRRPIMFAGMIFAYFYYSMQKTISAFDPASALMKCAACMFIGMFLFDVVSELREKKLKTATKICLTVVELACLAYAILAGPLSFTPVKMQTVVYMIMLTIMLSGQSYTAKIKAPLFTWLGRISMPLFIWHYAVGRVLIHFVGRFSTTKLLVAFFVGSIVVAIVSDFIVQMILKKIGQKKAAS
jgi:peptidoglycan/LPS O-acetylase OafA/YrhL